jgi:hypothetical protein
MQARKRKLEELKRLQAEGQPQVSMEEMKQENDKLNKQVRTAALYTMGMGSSVSCAENDTMTH